ncbi:MAG: hypothetical protein SW833_10810 [Cyanobacteriota bacterium]|nr:hypothetical protein [Cyanobacteriota bacterium]
MNEGTDAIVDIELGSNSVGLGDEFSLGQLSLTQQGRDTVLGRDRELGTLLHDLDAEAPIAMPDVTLRAIA